MLEWLDPDRSLGDNIRHVILSPGSMWVAEPTFLLYDEVREPGTHLAVLKAIGVGNHTLSEISDAALVSKAHLSAYFHTAHKLTFMARTHEHYCKMGRLVVRAADVPWDELSTAYCGSDHRRARAGQPA